MALRRNGFQNAVNQQLPPAAAGDFCGAGFRTFVPAPLGQPGYVADTAGVVVGRFAWADPATGLVTNVNAANRLLGFVHREQGQTLITAFLGYAVDVIRQGLPVALLNRGSVWGKFTAGAAVGAQVYASPTDGSLSTSSGGGNILTPFYVVTPVVADSAFTGVIDVAGVLTVSALSGGALSPGQFIDGAGVPANTYIVSQLTGTAGSTGTYRVSALKVVTSTAMTATAGKLAKISTLQVA